MNCPHCDAIIHHGTHECPQCSFSLTRLRPLLGDQWVRLDRITDIPHSLRLDEFRRLEIALDEFERNFPQSFVAIYIGQLPRNLRPAELGFWLLNHGAFNTPQVTKRNDFGITIVIDFNSGLCSLTVGYAIEGLTPPQSLARIAKQLSVDLRRSQMGGGLVAAVRDLKKNLLKKGKPESRQPGHHGTPVSGIGLAALRSGHHPQSSTADSEPRPSR